MVADAEGSRIEDELRMLMYDPQTSGGLLISVAAADAVELLGSLQGAGVQATRIGYVAERQATSPAIILK